MLSKASAEELRVVLAAYRKVKNGSLAATPHRHGATRRLGR